MYYVFLTCETRMHARTRMNEDRKKKRTKVQIKKIYLFRNKSLQKEGKRRGRENKYNRRFRHVIYLNVINKKKMEFTKGANKRKISTSLRIFYRF